jgi:flagella basal body P-ring formation protein FlgA
MMNKLNHPPNPPMTKRLNQQMMMKKENQSIKTQIMTKVQSKNLHADGEEDIQVDENELEKELVRSQQPKVQRSTQQKKQGQLMNVKTTGNQSYVQIFAEFKDNAMMQYTVVAAQVTAMLICEFNQRWTHIQSNFVINFSQPIH